ncbi:MAG: ribbon-helix-helix protein, CopG family [Bryobacterales bacterium]|nr:ribbon-helix-helix protein, CopG family [Bryobacterales bacterium]MBV9397120.1 ribbon-helix-helix protein, CopG family [Bryobacterales bacterium]
MALVKATFTLDDVTIGKLAETAKRLSKPKSQVLREAIADYHAKSDRLSEAERARMLRAVREMMAEPPTRTQAEVDRELRELRASRRTGWRRRSD